MTRLWLLIFLINIALTVAALISCLSTEDSDIRGLPRVVWVLIILLFSPIGAIAWLIAGREPSAARRGGQWRPGSGFPERERPGSLAPDDDPAFLRRLAAEHERSKAEDDALLRSWEADLKRREEDLRRKTQGEAGSDRG